MNRYILICNPYDVVEILKALQKEQETADEDRRKHLEEIRHQIYRAIGKAEEL